ncbi:transcriptional repressor [Pelagicoccus sp. SDUM812003]|uniref:Fur family transcriptional regulator n=1 Tax=Pelagicoccus sp. SDUM812003 TaxID=3041267 RepID=UPI002810517A|nr:transcriptional repressor [Pelagicoccus sp. SDUM812003]MDQ8202011.1 transcriptional repressor [Pelagicoccus sp. SDUM812003]
MNNEIDTEVLNRKLAASGLRSTRQREVVYGAILSKRDHPTADEIFARAKLEMPTISLATVYNCLETLVQCDLIKQVHLERESTRYCPNLTEHAHFHDNESGDIYDVQLDAATIQKLTSLLPSGFVVGSIDITFRGKAAASSTS